jgi:hypothetical protein
MQDGYLSVATTLLRLRHHGPFASIILGRRALADEAIRLKDDKLLLLRPG